MSTIEERLSRDIAAVTGGIIVTDSDLRDAREEVDERIESRRQRDRRRHVGVAVAAAVAVVVGVTGWQLLNGDGARLSPAPPAPTPTGLSKADEAFLSGSAPTPDLVRGVWRLDNSKLVMSFTADGAIRFDDSGRLFTSPAVDGTYAIEGDLISVEVDGGRAGCAGQTFEMRASVPEAGYLHFLHTKRGTGNCAPAPSVRWVMEQVLSPTNKGLAGVKTGGANLDPPKGADALRGLWFSEGGGHVVELSPQGSYTMAGDYGDVVDRGTWSLDSSNTRLTLDSGPDSPTCREGDRFVLGSLAELVDGSFANLNGTVEQNDCGGAWAKDGWIRLSP